MKICRDKRRSGKLDASGWLVSGGLLLLIPKCPVCLAAYVAAFTGLGLSLPVAVGLRWWMIGLCVASLGFLTVRMLRRIHRSGNPNLVGRPSRQPGRRPGRAS